MVSDVTPGPTDDNTTGMDYHVSIYSVQDVPIIQGVLITRGVPIMRGVPITRGVPIIQRVSTLGIFHVQLL